MSSLINHSQKESFRQDLQTEFKAFLTQQSKRFDPENCLKIDFHCHDHNSDIPDELWGRILRLPETWLKTKHLVKTLKDNGSDVITVTNHNNARSCWKLQEKGVDVLVGAEFTCFFPEYDLFVHVLTYGFTKEQETILNDKRHNIYDFLRYTHSINVPVILPHPLYFYTRNEKIDISLFEKFAVLFQRFEVLNGQRDVWQSVLTLNWARGLTAEKIISYAKKHDLDPTEFGVNPYAEKVLTGGSDDHTGIFAGQCGSFLYIDNLQQRLKTSKASDLALEAIRNGNIAPYGSVGENQKLNIALLDYFSQVATKIKDPGLFRILLHRGTPFDKVACFTISNLLLEMQKHKNTMKFFSFVHDALKGKKPSKIMKWAVSKDYRFCIQYLERIADAHNESPEVFADTVNDCINSLFTSLNKLIVSRIETTMSFVDIKQLKAISAESITQKFEVPSQLTALFLGDGKKQDNLSNVKVGKILDKLSFPVLISLMLAGSSLASTRVLYQNRNFLNEFSTYIGKNKHQKRALYLTDTLTDKNGVSNSLSGKLKEIQRADLPVDFLICHSNIAEEPHLHVVKPLAKFNLPQYPDQEIRIPDIMEIARIFYEGGYDRIVCSTEGPMALASMFIKEMFNVKSYFFMHTDWMDFIKATTDLNQYSQDRVRRILRAMYNRYDGVFVLNSDHKEWLTGYDMQLPKENVFITAHHAQPVNLNIAKIKKSDLIPGATEDTPVLFIACRISKEKGLFDLPKIIDKARRTLPNLKIVIAGQGPATEELKQALPDAIFLGWQSKQQLSSLYMSLDLFIFPSQFDTFGNVIIESFAHGMPALAYNSKGPKSIIQNNINGFLVDDIDDMADRITEFFDSNFNRSKMKLSAMQRAAEYQAEPIMEKFLLNMGLDIPALYNNQRTVA
ncbi:MAG: glycosyltransferase involved in cell wall biosynthesis [Psychrobacter glaciei]|jgi:glycosyltransferase involved in cell wall biosynthesis